MAKWSCSTQILPACFAWGLFLILTLLFFAFPCRYIFTELGQVGTITTIYDCVLAVVVFIHFLAATVIDPGKYPKASLTDNENTDHRNPFSKHIDINGVSFRMKWCTTCQFFRPPRCSHCSVCDTCIDTFDHHCPWVNNCIGRRNYRHFVLFLLSLWIHMISVLALSIMSILLWQQKNENLIEVIPIISIIECCLVAILLLPVTGLTTFHLYLISSGRTTNEQVTGKVKADLNPFSKGCIINWVTVFYSSQYPKLITNVNQELLERVNISKESPEAEPFLNDNHKVWVDNQKVPTVEITDVKDDVSSIASSAIVAELNISARKNRGQQLTNANSKNNLVRIETAPSISDYYVQLDSDPSYSDSVKLVGLNVKNGIAVLKTSQQENLEDISPVDDDNTILLKQTQ